MATFEQLLKRLEKNEGYQKAQKEFGPLFDFVNALIDLRIEKGLTQKDLSDLTGIAVPTLSRIEAGKQNLSFKTMQTLVNALGGKLCITPKADSVVELNCKAKESLDRVVEKTGMGKSELIEGLISVYEQVLDGAGKHSIELMKTYQLMAETDYVGALAMTFRSGTESLSSLLTDDFFPSQFEENDELSMDKIEDYFTRG
ncbi:helix-turn-helix transcriptional regulator [Mesotoga prima]|uniref:helix-turn-helix transcriptional regulator n=1 Tax=Mesotoga prima TaxID=1184387 RepID=UPI001BD533B7|nr:helix-turn-helix domain-containing protein [Mesotoga prima]HNQ71922.1 helix-turn-helix transcriptional regulator [Mesotoga prima]